MNKTDTVSALTQLPTPWALVPGALRRRGTKSRRKGVVGQGCVPTRPASPPSEHQEDYISQPPCSVMGSRDQLSPGHCGMKLWTALPGLTHRNLPHCPPHSLFTGLQSLQQGPQTLSVKARGQIFSVVWAIQCLLQLLNAACHCSTKAA